MKKIQKLNAIIVDLGLNELDAWAWISGAALTAAGMVLFLNLV